MTFPDGLLIPVEQINSLPQDKVVVLTTGSQGEPLSALSRIARNEHKQIKIMPGDTIVISATPIPGNEQSIAKTINALSLRGADVIYGRDACVHVSGHACREEQKLMLNLCKPKFFMPVHGEYRMLVTHGELAVDCGVEKDNVFIMDNGDVLEISPDKGQKLPPIKSGVILVDFSRAWEIDEQIVAERRHLAEDGVVVVALTIDGEKNILGGPDVSMRGLILPQGVSPEEILETIKHEVLLYLKDKTAIASLNGDALKTYVHDLLNTYFSDKAKSQPLIQIVLQEIQSAGAKAKAADKAKSKT